jgi:hypothetical protein
MLLGNRFGTPLPEAAWEGRLSIVNLLLTQGAKVNLQAGWYGNAL